MWIHIDVRFTKHLPRGGHLHRHDDVFKRPDVCGTEHKPRLVDMQGNNHLQFERDLRCFVDYMPGFGDLPGYDHLPEWDYLHWVKHVRRCSDLPGDGDLRVE